MYVGSHYKTCCKDLEEAFALNAGKSFSVCVLGDSAGDCSKKYHGTLQTSGSC